MEEEIEPRMVDSFETGELETTGTGRATLTTNCTFTVDEDNAEAAGPSRSVNVNSCKPVGGLRAVNKSTNLRIIVQSPYANPEI